MKGGRDGEMKGGRNGEMKGGRNGEMKGGRNRRGEKKGLKAKGDIKDGEKDKG